MGKGSSVGLKGLPEPVAAFVARKQTVRFGHIPTR
jgi:hypothetical protein